MNASILTKIVAATRTRVATLPHSSGAPPVRRGEGQRFREALTASRPAIIAEIKRASPSRGVFNPTADAAVLANAYVRGGAAAISVLTEPRFFQGSNQDLIDVTAAVGLPVLRKDFILAEAQLLESVNLGASAVLLIAAILSLPDLKHLRRVAEDDLGMAALVEVHDAAEFQRALDSGASLIGINNRDLHTFNVSLGVSEDLAGLAPPGVTLVAESGIRSSADVHRLQRAGIHAFLVGEHLVSAPDPKEALRSLKQGTSA